MEDTFKKIVFGILIFGLASNIAACGKKKAAVEVSEKIVVSENGKSQICVPEDWKKENSEGGFFLTDKEERISLSIKSMPQNDNELTNYSTYVIDESTKALIDGKIVNSTDKIINGMQAKIIEFEGKINAGVSTNKKQFTVYYITAVIKGSHDFHLIQIGLEKKELKDFQKICTKAIESFEELPESESS